MGNPPQRDDAGAVLCSVAGSCSGRGSGRLWKRQGGSQILTALLGHVRTGGPIPGFHSCTLSPVSVPKTDKQDGAGICLHPSVRVFS